VLESPTALFYHKLSTAIRPIARSHWVIGAASVTACHDKKTGSSNRGGHKRLVFRVTADVFLHERANRNHS
jgi:hypothetical protein